MKFLEDRPDSPVSQFRGILVIEEHVFRILPNSTAELDRTRHRPESRRHTSHKPTTRNPSRRALPQRSAENLRDLGVPCESCLVARAPLDMEARDCAPGLPLFVRCSRARLLCATIHPRRLLGRSSLDESVRNPRIFAAVYSRVRVQLARRFAG